MGRNTNSADEYQLNIQRFINKYKNLDSDEISAKLLDENEHGLGGLEYTFNQALRSSRFDNWQLGQLLTAKRLLKGLIDAGGKVNARYDEIIKKIQFQIDK